MQFLDYAALKGRGILFSKTHLWRLIKASQFPKPVKLGGGRNSWLASEIDEWVQSRVDARDGGAGVAA
jgi:prophage regulatory protein